MGPLLRGTGSAGVSSTDRRVRATVRVILSALCFAAVAVTLAALLLLSSGGSGSPLYARAHAVENEGSAHRDVSLAPVDNPLVRRSVTTDSVVGKHARDARYAHGHAIVENESEAIHDVHDVSLAPMTDNPLTSSIETSEDFAVRMARNSKNLAQSCSYRGSRYGCGHTYEVCMP